MVQNIVAWCKCWSKTSVRFKYWSKIFARSKYWSNLCQVHPGQIHPGLLPSETVELGSNQKKMCETPGCIGKQSFDVLTSLLKHKNWLNLLPWDSKKIEHHGNCRSILLFYAYKPFASGVSHMLLDNMDQSVSPCDDFYQVDRGWIILLVQCNLTFDWWFISYLQIF